MGVTVEIQGGDKYKKFLAKMAEIAGGVKAGILEGATNRVTGEPIAPYAVYNEFGTSRIPARPFMRTVAKSESKKWVGTMVGHIRGRATDPAIWKQALGKAGEQMEKDIQHSIQNGSWTPNAPATVRAIARKGKGEPDHPLMDTGEMFAAVSFEVVDK
jgi:hypothetical protein